MNEYEGIGQILFFILFNISIYWSRLESFSIFFERLFVLVIKFRPEAKSFVDEILLI